MRKDFSADQDKLDLQFESQIHIEVQNELEKRVIEEPGPNVASAELLRWIHERFYLRLPEHSRWIEGNNKARHAPRRMSKRPSRLPQFTNNRPTAF
jgi:hypothetical protein